jgi:hypothetical protein
MTMSIGVSATPIAILRAGHTEIATPTEEMVGTVQTVAMTTVILPIRPDTMPIGGPIARRKVGTGTTARVARDHQQAALTARHAVTTAMPIALGIVDDLEVIGDNDMVPVLMTTGQPALTPLIETSVRLNMDHLAGRKDMRAGAHVDLHISIVVTITGPDRPELKQIAADRTPQTVARPIESDAMTMIGRGGQQSEAVVAMGRMPDPCRVA